MHLYFKNNLKQQQKPSISCWSKSSPRKYLSFHQSAFHCEIWYIHHEKATDTVKRMVKLGELESLWTLLIFLKKMKTRLINNSATSCRQRKANICVLVLQNLLVVTIKLHCHGTGCSVWSQSLKELSDLLKMLHRSIFLISYKPLTNKEEKKRIVYDNIQDSYWCKRSDATG